MFKNYLKTSWRNIIKDKSYSGFNILGLSIGMAVALAIGLWAQYQFSYDRFLPQYQHAYMAMMRYSHDGESDAGAATCLPLAAVLKKDIPEIKYVAQADWMGQHGLVAGNRKLYINGAFAGEDFLHIFQYPLLKGNAAAVLKEPASIVLTKATATALFGNQDPIDKIVRIDNLYDVKVTGILADLPANSTFQFNYIIPFSLYVQTQDWIKHNMDNWNLNPIQTFVALQPGANVAQVDLKLKGLPKQYDEDGYKQLHIEAFLQPLANWHLYGRFENGVLSGGFIDYVRMFGIIGALVLLIACINFINLSTARSERRAREVGVRKAIGSLRKHIIFQFLTESLLIALIAFAFALFLVSLALPAFNMLTESTIRMPWSNMAFWGIMLAYVLFTALLAGSRPAFYLSSFKPVNVLKGKLHVGKSAALPRKVLVVLQFTCSAALIISTITVYRQIQYAKNRPAGYNANRLVMTDGSSDLDRQYTALKNDLLHTGMVSSVTKATAPATALYSWTGVDDWQTKNPGESLGVATVGITGDYFSTLGMQLAAGRDFKGAQDSGKVIMNEAAVRRMRFKDPLGQIIHWNNGQKIQVVGVVKDALMISPFSPAEPTFFVYNAKWSGSIMYRLSPNVGAGAAIATFASIFAKYNPSYPYIYHFADEGYAAKFKQEELVGRLSGIFAVLAIFISCLGLFGLAAYVAQQRTKEIGIRKVLGASVMQVVVLISREFIVLVALGCLIASPLARYFLHNWLQGYYYHISIGPGIFIVSAMVAVFITIATVSFQSVKAALMNPARSLKSE